LYDTGQIANLNDELLLKSARYHRPQNY